MSNLAGCGATTLTSWANAAGHGKGIPFHWNGTATGRGSGSPGGRDRAQIAPPRRDPPTARTVDETLVTRALDSML